jgi:two-component system cell cycle sensor histidine kinase/response regulator CckA
VNPETTHERPDALPENEEWLRTFFENAQVGLFRTRLLDGKMIWCNKILAQRLGYQSVRECCQEYVARDHYEPEDRTRLLQELQAKGSVENFEIQISRRDGVFMWASLFAKLFPEKGFLEGAVIDITERKKIESALRASEERYRELFEHINSGVAVYEVVDDGNDFIFREFNKAAEKIDNEQREKIIGRSIFEVRPGIEKFGLIDVFRKVWKTGVPEFHPVTFYEDGKISGWYENYVYKLPSGAIVTVFENVTERKRIENDITASEERYRSIVENMNDGFLIHDFNGLISDCNETICHNLGYRRDELIGMNLHGFVAASNQLLINERMEKLRSTGSLVFDSEHRRKDGSSYAVNVSARLVSAKGAGTIQSFMRDITERKQREDRIRTQRDLGIALSGVKNLSEGLRLCLDAALKVSGLDCGGIYLFDELTGDLDLKHQKGFSEAFVELVSKFSTDSPNAALVRTGKPVFSMHKSVMVSLDDVRLREGLRALAVIPLRYEGDVIGCLNLASHIVTEVPEGSKLDLEIISQQIASEVARFLAKEKLAASEEMFSKAFKSSPMAIGISELESGKLIDINDAFCRMIGVLREEVLGRTSAELGIWDNPRQREIIIGKIREPEMDRFIEIQCRTKSGKTLTVVLSASIISWRGSQCLLISAFDITLQKKAEESLRSSERRNRDLLSAIPDLMFKVRKDGTIVDLKYDRPEQLFVPPGEVKGSNIFDLPLSAPELGAVKKAVADALATGDMQTFEYSLPIGGKKRIYDARTVREDDETVITIIRDMTEIKTAEENQIKTEKLEAIGTLAGGIAHDFNNLLGGVFGYLEMAKEQAEMGKISRTAVLLGKALAVFDRAKGLTAQFLTFTKGGAPAKKTGDLHKMLSDTVVFALSGSSVKCIKNIAADLWPCDYDEHQIGQVIDNIVINAKQAMEKGGMLEVTAANTVLGKDSPIPLPEGRYVKISFRDNGPGIPAELHRKIFDPFFTTKKKGTGLGLATAFSVVKKHGGHLDLESEVGKGATFTVLLPAAGKSPAADGEEVPAPDAYTGPRLEAKIKKIRARILVMDDEEYMRELAASALRSLGYMVTTAKNGEEALAWYTEAGKRKKAFDAVILDLTIPGGMGGKEAAQKLLAADPAARLIVSSGYSDDPIMAEPDKYGFITAISKPYKKEDLAAVISDVLGT